MEAAGAAGIRERSDAEVRQLEGLAPVLGVLRGPQEPGRVVISENGLRFEVDLVRTKRGMWMFSGKALVDGQVAASGDLMMTVRTVEA